MVQFSLFTYECCRVSYRCQKAEWTRTTVPSPPQLRGPHARRARGAAAQGAAATRGNPATKGNGGGYEQSAAEHPNCEPVAAGGGGGRFNGTRSSGRRSAERPGNARTALTERNEQNAKDRRRDGGDRGPSDGRAISDRDSPIITVN